MNNAPISIHLEHDGIVIELYDGQQVKRRLGQYWYLGAIDTDTYPYEVQVTVVRRQRNEKDDPEAAILDTDTSGDTKKGS